MLLDSWLVGKPPLLSYKLMSTFKILSHIGRINGMKSGKHQKKFIILKKVNNFLFTSMELIHGVAVSLDSDYLCVAKS